MDISKSLKLITGRTTGAVSTGRTPFKRLTRRHGSESGESVEANSSTRASEVLAACGSPGRRVTCTREFLSSRDRWARRSRGKPHVDESTWTASTLRYYSPPRRAAQRALGGPRRQGQRLRTGLRARRETDGAVFEFPDATERIDRLAGEWGVDYFSPRLSEYTFSLLDYIAWLCLCTKGKKVSSK